MHLLAYWRCDNYVRDLDKGAGFNFNSKQSRLHSAIELGETLWLFTCLKAPTRYFLVAKLVVRSRMPTARRCSSTVAAASAGNGRSKWRRVRRTPRRCCPVLRCTLRQSEEREAEDRFLLRTGSRIAANDKCSF